MRGLVLARTACLAALLLVPLSIEAEPPGEQMPLTPAEAAQLTPDGLSNLQRLVEHVRHGALGVDVEGAHFRPSYQGLSSDGAVRFEVVHKGGGRSGFILLRPPLPGTATVPRYFLLLPDDGVAPEQVAQLAAVLDTVFTTNPWSGDPSTYRPHWHSEGAIGDPSGRARAFCGIVFLIASAIAGLLFLFGARPRSDGERIFGSSNEVAR